MGLTSPATATSLTFQTLSFRGADELGHAPVVPKTRDELLTPEDVEREYRLNRSTLRSRHFRQHLPHVRMAPRIVRYRRSDLEAFVAARRVG